MKTELTTEFKNLITDKNLKRRFDNSIIEKLKYLEQEILEAPLLQKSLLITEIPPEGIIIEKPGKYEFANNISWNPTVSCTAITIVTDNVELNLKGYILKANLPLIAKNKPNIKVKGISAINTMSVYIHNGIIDGVSYFGIHASKNIDLKLNDLIIDNLNCYDTKNKDLTPCGIFIESTDGISITNCSIYNISVTTPSCAGIQLIKSTNAKITTCKMKFFNNKDGGVQGFSYLFSSKIRTEDCSCENFQSHYKGLTKTTGHTVIGFIPIFCEILEFNFCNAKDMTGCCDDCHGMSIFLNSNVLVNDFYANNIVDGITPSKSGAKATGLEVYGNNILINNCVSENIKAIVPQDLQAAGFSAWGNYITFTDCIASNVVVTDSYEKPSIECGFGVGFGWAPDPRPEFDKAASKIQYNNCHANNCQVGFDTWNHIDSLWNKVIAQNCKIFILAQPEAERTLSLNKCSELQKGNSKKVTLTNKARDNFYPEEYALNL